MSENKNAKTPADGPDYERGFIDGMQHQMQLSVKINKEPTKIFGPNLGSILNRAGFYEKREWVGLTYEEVSEIINREIGFNSCFGPEEKFARAVEQALKEKNHG
jgi:hypothetical protein